MAGSMTPTPGLTVHTSDGEKVGMVKDVEGRFFKVAVPLRRDYWLDSATVLSVDGNGVRLAVAKDDLRDYKKGRPSL